MTTSETAQARAFAGLSLVALLLFHPGCAPAKVQAVSADEAVTRVRLEDMAEYAYSTGCYQAYTAFCSKFKKDEPRDACFTEGLNGCELKAKSFKDFLHGKPRL